MPNNDTKCFLCLHYIVPIKWLCITNKPIPHATSPLSFQPRPPPTTTTFNHNHHPQPQPPPTTTTTTHNHNHHPQPLPQLTTTSNNDRDHQQPQQPQQMMTTTWQHHHQWWQRQPNGLVIFFITFTFYFTNDHLRLQATCTEWESCPPPSPTPGQRRDTSKCIHHHLNASKPAHLVTDYTN